MVESRFLVGDTVRIQGGTRIWEVSDIGDSERMKEYTYILENEGSRRKVLEHQMETAPVVFSLKEISAALKRVESRYCTEITKGLTSAGADDRDIQLMTNMVSEAIEEVQKELIGGRNNEQSLSG